METMQFLLSKIFLAICILVVVWLGYLLLQKNFSGFHFSSTHFFTDDLLPDPMNVGLMNQPKTADLSPYVNNNWRSPGVSYVEYTGTGMKITTTSTSNGLPASTTLSSGFSPVTLYVRALSLYTSGSIYTGITFSGEARNTLFADGIFPVYVTDTLGNILSVDQAVAVKSMWTEPGWTRFTVTLHGVYPVRQLCRMIFRAAPGAQAAYSGTQVVIPIKCN